MRFELLLRDLSLRGVSMACSVRGAGVVAFGLVGAALRRARRYRVVVCELGSVPGGSRSARMRIGIRECRCPRAHLPRTPREEKECAYLLHGVPRCV